MIFIPLQNSFICENCRLEVSPLPHGTYRNHCPSCLWSKHVDEEGPGDRSSHCLGMMRPAMLDRNSKKGWVIIHECMRCHKQSRNKCAPDDDVVSFIELNKKFDQ